MPAFVHLLGVPSVQVGEVVYELRPGRRSAALLYLAYRGGWVMRDELLYLFWPDTEEHKARTNLRQLLRGLRASPHAAGLEIEHSRLRWQVDTDLTEVGRAWAPEDELLRGFRVPDAPEFEDWLALERTALRERARTELMAWTERALQAGDAAEAARRLGNWLQQDPLDEEALHRFMLSCLRTGQAADGRRRFQLFEQHLGRELGLDPSPRLRRACQELEAADAALVADVPSSASDPAPAQVAWGAGLLPRTRFVGRDEELGRLSDALARQEGMVCQIMGAGGMGKTRLALEVARRVAPRLDGDVVHVPLVDARSSEEALAALAGAAGSEAGAEVPAFDRAVTTLAGRRSLVVMDNLEQINDVESAIDRLREALPLASWLLTSRRRLGLEALSLIELSGLSQPPAGSAVLSGAAAELFLDRTRGLGVEVDAAADGATVAALLRQLGGMPLAIELAAAWCRLLPPSALLDRVSGSRGLPTPPDGAWEARHASVELALLASWDLLAAPQKEALIRLSVFQDGCTVQAAEEVGGVRLSTLATLRDASMLSVTREGRVRFHPLVERFLRDQAGGGGWDLDEVKATHANHYLRLVKQMEDLGQSGDLTAIDILQAEHANIEQAWNWALVHEDWNGLMLAGCAFLGLSYTYAGRAEQWSRLMRRAVDRVPDDTLAWAVLTAHEATLQVFDGRLRDGYLRQARAREVALRFPDQPFWLAWVLFHYSHAAESMGEVQPALEAMTEADRLLESIGEVHVRGMVVNDLYRKATTRDERERLYRVGEEVRRLSGSPEHDVNAWSIRAMDLAFLEGRYHEALELVDAAVDLERRQRWTALDLPVRLCRAAMVRIAVGDLEAALRLLKECLEMGRPFAVGTYVNHRKAVDLLAWTLWLAGDPEAAHDVLSGPDADMQPAGTDTLRIEAEMALEAGDVAGARQKVAFTNSMRKPGRGRFTHLARVETRLLDARVAVVEGRPAEAARLLLACTAAVVEHGFIPAGLEAMVVASDLLGTALAGRVLEVVRAHPATHFQVCRRLGLERAGALRDDGDGSAVDLARSALLREVSTALEALVQELEGVELPA